MRGSIGSQSEGVRLQREGVGAMRGEQWSLLSRVALCCATLGSSRFSASYFSPSMFVVQKSRRAALPTISVVILLSLIEQWLQGRGSRDVEILLRDVKQQLSWKKAPRAGPLAGVADLSSCSQTSRRTELSRQPSWLLLCRRPTRRNP